ncbi:hypothetical protein EC917_117121 [Bacillus thuringiensis]|uniref:Uncharacterized protein n=1 Tax=Bacillus thuringiensis TaxID=1428 RepID=A0A4R4B7F8_BACTU|nr:hypothetical protein EC917_117121 [Bacillus thuringiensis]TCW50396.1 hypothetical protein EC910_117121 [Bacillus thuringiensis]
MIILVDTFKIYCVIRDMIFHITQQYLQKTATYTYEGANGPRTIRLRKGDLAGDKHPVTGIQEILMELIQELVKEGLISR